VADLYGELKEGGHRVFKTNISEDSTHCYNSLIRAIAVASYKLKKTYTPYQGCNNS